MMQQGKCPCRRKKCERHGNCAACVEYHQTQNRKYAVACKRSKKEASMDLDKVVCVCQNVTNGMIKDAVEAGAKTFEEVQEVTGAGTVCGGCAENVQHLVEQFTKE